MPEEVSWPCQFNASVSRPRRGLFGYNEHELINRRFTLIRDMEDITAKLEALEMPVEVVQLKMAPDKSYYVTTPAQLTYPRPKVMPEVIALMKDYRDVSDSLGGSAVYQRTTDGRYDLVVVQSTEALAALVRTTGNNIFDRYFSGPEGKTRRLRLGLSPLDQEHKEHPTVLTNSTWGMLAPLYDNLEAEPKQIPRRE